MENFKLPLDMVLESIFTGVLLSLAYFSLLWYSLKMLPKVKRKGLFLFVSSLLRFFLFGAVAVLLAKEHHSKLLLMFLAFIITRLFWVHFYKRKEVNHA